ncbi:phage holin [Lactococcus lactis]|uniref:phage holin n=1 Tax=Lactococcus lactis TaxID=1358 RepID=UPI00265A5B23|nr:phage holin [Lactococcus lactis]WKG35976.1 phage holin [Lactococcus lactis subsp. lactis]
MDQNLMTIFSGILTVVGSVVSYFISQAAKKHSNVKNIDALAKLANQAVSWVQKNYTDNPEKLSEAINYVTEEAKNLKIKTNPAQIEAQIEASLAQLKKNFTADPAKTIKDVAQATSEVAQSVSKTADNISTNAEELANLVEPIINGTEGLTEE